MQVNSFIFNSKKYVFILGEIAIAVFVCFCVGKNIHYLLVDDVNSYTRIMMHEFYNQENIDTLFLGSSHCYRSIDTVVTDDILEENTFNAGSSSQHFDASYALLIEAEKKYAIKRVCLEMYYYMSQEAAPDEREELTSTYIISDYMRPSVNATIFKLKTIPREHFINGFFPARRNWHNVFNGDLVSEMFSKKQTEAYKKYQYIDNGNEYYAGKGYVASREQVPGGIFISNKLFDSIPDNAIKENNKEEIIKIINYCKKKDIELILFSAPMPDFLLNEIGNYDDYIECVVQMATEHNVKYYDFNLCKEKYFLNKAEYFKDTNHLNADGAEKFSEAFSYLLNDEADEKELFYDSYIEKIGCQDFKIYGFCEYIDGEEENGCRVCRISDNGNEEVEYKFSRYEEETGTIVLLQDFSRKKSIYIPVDEHGKMYVEYKKNKGNAVEMMEFEY